MKLNSKTKFEGQITVCLVIIIININCSYSNTNFIFCIFFINKFDRVHIFIRSITIGFFQ